DRRRAGHGRLGRAQGGHGAARGARRVPPALPARAVLEPAGRRVLRRSGPRRARAESLSRMSAEPLAAPAAIAEAAAPGASAAFARALRGLLVLPGAGCWVASGIPESRDHDGTWKSRPPMRFAEFVSSAAARRRYWGRSMVGWERVATARPARVHDALA